MRRRSIVLILGIVAITLIGILMWNISQSQKFEYQRVRLAETAVSALEELNVKNFLPSITSSEKQGLRFELVVIDPDNAGDVKLLGDMDGDGFPDLIIGGMPDEKLNWYRYPDWQKTVIAAPDNEFTTDGALGDVDGDGDLDIVVPDGDGVDNLLWFENPLPGGQPTDGSQWNRHIVGSIGSWGKDVELADFDGNGRLDVATRDSSSAMIFFQNAANSWQQMTFTDGELGNEGMASGDVDGDGLVDLILRGVWWRNPGGTAAQMSSNWIEYAIGTADTDFKALVVDLNQDGQMDVLFSSSESWADVDWWTPANGDPTGTWTKQTIVPNLEGAHTLQAADMDLDGDIDVVLGQMHTSSDQEIMVMLNLDGQATTWQKQLVATGGIHNGVVGDIGNDGDYDIYGANWTGNPPVRLWENRLDAAAPPSSWTYHQVTDNHTQTFGLGFGDINADGQQDIVSGRHWYRNPGGNLTGIWEQSTFPDDMHAFAVLDIDNDAQIDVLAQKDEGEIGVYWLEATTADGSTWTTTRVGSVDQASHDLGAQGYRTAVFKHNGMQPIVLISSGNGIYYFNVPDNPQNGNWPRVHVHSNPSDEGFAVGDIDGDGVLDIAATTGGSKHVEWYKNPGDGSDEWQEFQIGDFNEAEFPDRTELADLNGNGRLDIIVTEENGQDADAQTFWWEQPPDPTTTNWIRHPLVTQATTNSMDTADMDADGDMDIILAEHRGDRKLSVWDNSGNGNFSELPISTGKESHLGAQTIDLDGDGDLDIVSIAWDESYLVHLWRNDSVQQQQQSQQPLPSQSVSPTLVPTFVPTLVAAPLATQASPATPQNNGNRLSENPIVLYTFDEGSGTVIRDVSGFADPLDLDISDTANTLWLENGGLAIKAPTLLGSSQNATKIIQAIQTSDEISVEAWLRPENITQEGPARIMTLSADPFNRNFTLGQETNRVDFRLRTTQTSQNGTPAVEGNGLRANEVTHLVYKRDATGTAVLYINGIEAGKQAIPGDMSNWDTNFQFAIANELTHDRPWLGELYLVAVYDHALSTEEILQNYNAGCPCMATEQSQSNSSVNTAENKPAAGQVSTPAAAITAETSLKPPVQLSSRVPLSTGSTNERTDQTNNDAAWRQSTAVTLSSIVLILIILFLYVLYRIRRNSISKT